MARLAVVTGGTRGIGEAISIALKNAGYDVAANYAGNTEAAQKFEKATGIKTFRWDVSSNASCQEGIAEVEKTFGKPVDILINNAGITRDGAFHKMPEENWHAVLETNLSSCFYMAQAVIGSMRDRGFGRIISISSVNGQLGQFGQTNYSAAKSGIFGFTKALALETAAKGITVNAVAPGYIGTEMVAAMKKEVLDQIVAKVPVKRLGSAEDVARCVVFLVADEAGYITGETLSVNGGLHME